MHVTNREGEKSNKREYHQRTQRKKNQHKGRQDDKQYQQKKSDIYREIEMT